MSRVRSQREAKAPSHSHRDFVARIHSPLSKVYLLREQFRQLRRLSLDKKNIIHFVPLDPGVYVKTGTGDRLVKPNKLLGLTLRRLANYPLGGGGGGGGHGIAPDRSCYRNLSHAPETINKLAYSTLCI